MSNKLAQQYNSTHCETNMGNENRQAYHLFQNEQTKKGLLQYDVNQTSYYSHTKHG